MRALPDAALVERARDGDERAFEAIWDRHHAAILSFCRHLLGSREEAEDAVQHTFISAYGSLVDSRRDIALKAWLYTIARNRCLSMLRARREEAAEDVAVSTGGLSDEVERREELRGLLADLEELPEHQRSALILAELGDLSHAEIAGVLDCEAAQVKSYVFQARSALIDARKARETPCAEIREQLSTLRGGALRRRTLRRHLTTCQGCREFRDEVREQRGMLAVVLPVAPTLGLKEAAFAALGIGGGGGAGAAAAAKVAVVVAVAGGGAGGAVVIDEVKDGSQAPPAAVSDTAGPGVIGPAAEQAPGWGPLRDERSASARTPAVDRRDGASANGRDKPGKAGVRGKRRARNGATGPPETRGRELAVTRGEGYKYGLDKDGSQWAQPPAAKRDDSAATLPAPERSNARGYAAPALPDVPEKREQRDVEKLR